MAYNYPIYVVHFKQLYYALPVERTTNERAVLVLE
jgi:hypothetical protein